MLKEALSENDNNTSDNTVLILILMEHAQRAGLIETLDKHVDAVLILILMEHAQRGNSSW